MTENLVKALRTQAANLNTSGYVRRLMTSAADELDRRAALDVPAGEREALARSLNKGGVDWDKLHPHWQQMCRDHAAQLLRTPPAVTEAMVERMALALYRAAHPEVEGWDAAKYEEAYRTEAGMPLSGPAFLMKWARMAIAALQAA